ncbi:MAG TPA: tol-pal system protein YbgF [Hellea balneolensis]|uniref:Cell division coordinator CpoB n=1 Tax=Hellea balneolensis TaxID=287478 RepID=A0A7C5QRV1_9PROT|nr:tol-pal system protein YbgF [Hellea balneolensis]
MRIQVFILSVLLFVVSAQPAFAVSKKELEAQNAAMAERLSVLENRMLTGDPAAERLMQRMDALEAAQRTMTGEVERLRFERDGLQEEVRALAAQIVELQKLADEMKRHLKAVDAAARTPVPSPGSGTIIGGNRYGGGVYQGGSSLPPPPVISGGSSGGQVSLGNDISKLAEIGQKKMAQGDFTAAQTAFKQYLELNPDAADKGDIQFWLGETYYVKGGYNDAADAYIASMRTSPKGQYAPEAMVKLAATARALGKNAMACQTLASFPSQYPNAPASVKEKARQERRRSGC